jgi:hypothetical protein
VGLDQRTGELPPDESACPDHSDSHVSTVHHNRSETHLGSLSHWGA